MKKILSLILALLLVCPVLPVSAAGSPTLTVGTVTAQKGQSIAVPLTISGNTGICGARFRIDYDQKLTLTKVDTGTAFASLTLTKPGDLTANPVFLVWDGTDADTSNGVIVTLTFTAPQESGSFAVSASYEEGDITDGDLQEVTPVIQNGAVVIPNVISSVTLSGSVTTPVKNAEDRSNLNGNGVTATVTWAPALENGRFAQNTEYTATVTVSPAQGASFADTVSLSQLEGFSPFTKNAEGNYVATRTFARTSDKDAPIAEVPANLTATYGDTLGSITLTNAPGNTAGTWTWKEGAAGSVGNAGEQSHIAVFTPENTTDYAVIEKPITVTVSKAPLSITGATVADKVYNAKTDDAKVTAVTFGGLVNNETLVPGTDYSATGVYASADANDNCAVTVTVDFKNTAKLANYELPQTKTVSTTGKVSKAVTTLSITAKDAAYTGVAYDTANIIKTGNVETVPVYTYYADNNGAKGTALNAAPINAGTYWIEGNIAETTNNSAVTSEAVRFNITKAPLTITAKDKTIIYGDAPANDGVTYEGFVNGETSSVVTGLTYAYTYEQYENTGVYAVNLSGASADNYEITLKPGKLTVAQKTVGLAWTGYTELYYDGTAKEVTATATGLVNDDAVAVTVAGGAQTSIGSYTARATGLVGAKAANYKLPIDDTQAYTIAAALTSITVAPETVTAIIDQNTLTIKLVGYCGENEEIELTGLTIIDGKVAVNGVAYTVDQTGVIINKSNAVLTEAAPNVEKPEDAGEGITDAVVAEINDPATVSSGLDSAVAEAVFTEAAKDESIDTIEVTLSILPKVLTATTLKLEIRPQAVYKHGGDVVKTETIPNSVIKVPVTVSIKLPAGMPTVNLVAKHTIGDGKFEFLPVTVMGGVATWQQSSFSEVELISDSRTVTVNYTFDNGSGQTVTYGPADIGKNLPTDSKSGSTFQGWIFGADTSVYATLTDELLTALNGQTVNAVPSFRSSGGGGISGAGTKKPETQEPINPFADVPESAYYYDAVLWAVDRGITSGMTETTFAPEMSCTRAQAVTFLWRMAGEPKAVNAVNPFTDVTSADYFYDAVLWAVEQEITSGMTESTFAPDITVTRSQMVTLMWRAAGEPSTSTGTIFADVAGTDYYATAVAWAVEKGITAGTSDTTFSPLADCTRAQIVTFLYRNEA